MKFFEVREPPTKNLKEALLYPMAQYSNVPSVIERFERIEKIMDVARVLKPNELLLGAADPEFSTEPITIPFSGKSSRIIILGRTGSGKTMLAQNLVFDQFHGRFQMPTLVIDPKLEYFMTQKENKNQQQREVCRKYGIMPRGFYSQLVTPKFMNIIGNVGYQYTINLCDFKKILDKSNMIKTLIDFFEISGMGYSPARRMLWKIASKGIPDDIYEWRHEIYGIFKAKKMEGKRSSTVLIDMIEEKIGSELMGGKNAFDFPQGMNDYGIVVLQGSMQGGAEHHFSIYVKLAIDSVIYERMKQIRTGQSVMERPPCILVDEAKKFVPPDKHTPARASIEDIFTMGRAWGISCVLVAQDSSQLSEEVLKQADWVITSKLAGQADRQMLHWRGVDDVSVEQNLAQLGWDSLRYPKEHAAISPDGQIFNFFPIPSGCGKQQESYI